MKTKNFISHVNNRESIVRIYNSWLTNNRLAYTKYFNVFAIFLAGVLIPFDIILFDNWIYFTRFRIIYILLIIPNTLLLSFSKTLSKNMITYLFMIPGILFIGLYKYWLIDAPKETEFIVMFACYMIVFFLTFFYNRFWKEQYLLNAISVAGTLTILFVFPDLKEKMILLLIFEIGAVFTAAFFRREFVGSLYVNDLQQLNIELRKAKEKAEDSDKVKSLFLANMSHEIRTPLNTLLGFTQIIKEEISSHINEDQSNHFDIIERSGKRLMDTVHEILDMSQIDAGTFKLHPEVLDVIQIIRDLMEECSLNAGEKNITLNFENKSKNSSIWGDAYSLNHTLKNIFDNSIKYTKKGSINVNLKNINSNLQITIADSGIGMSDKFLKQAFNIFSQESEGYTKKYQGVGLGLALTHRLIELNHWDIKVKSKKNVGTTIYITMPIYKGIEKIQNPVPGIT